MLKLGAMKTILEFVARSGIATSWNKNDKELRLLGNRTIYFRSSDDPDSIRGANVGWLWLDEARQMTPDTWPTAIATLRKSPGRAWITSTPRGKNWMYRLFTSDINEYSIIHSRTKDNPYVPTHYIETLKNSMTSEMYLQEIEGEFIDPIDTMFRGQWFAVIDKAPPGIKWHRYWDLATSTKTSADYTASIRAGLGADGNIYLDGGIRIKAEWPDVRKIIIQTMLAEQSDTIVGIEEALHGLAAVQDLRRAPELSAITLRGIRVDKDKQSRAMPWAARAEAGAVKIIRGNWVRPFIDEVTTFPRGEHDDYVDAASCAVMMISKPKVDWGWA